MRKLASESLYINGTLLVSSDENETPGSIRKFIGYVAKNGFEAALISGKSFRHECLKDWN